MKATNIHKISKIVLWTCIPISIVIVAVLFYGLIRHSDWAETTGISILLTWLYILLAVNLIAVFAGIIWNSIKKS
jgi:hypothetical protein